MLLVLLLLFLLPLFTYPHPLELSPANCTNTTTISQLTGTYHAYRITVQQEHVAEFTVAVVTCSPETSIASVCRDVVFESLTDVKVSVDGQISENFQGSYHSDRMTARLAGTLSLSPNKPASLACVTPLSNGTLTSLTTNITSEQTFQYSINPHTQTVSEGRGFQLKCKAGTENEIDLAVWGAWNGSVSHMTDIDCEEKQEHNGLGFRCEIEKKERGGVWESVLTVFGDGIEKDTEIIFWCGHRGSFPIGVSEATVKIKRKGNGFWIGIGGVAVVLVVVMIAIAVKVLMKRSKLSTVMTYAKLGDPDADPTLTESRFSIS